MTEAETKSIAVESEMPHSPEKVWRGADHPRADRRMADEERLPARGRPPVPVQHHPRARMVEDHQRRGRRVEPPRRLVYRWGDGTQSDSGLRTVVTWTLTTTAGWNLVRMERVGFRPLDEGGYRVMGGGWPRIVAKLERVAGLLT